jgi:hypothetical protein
MQHDAVFLEISSHDDAESVDSEVDFDKTELARIARRRSSSDSGRQPAKIE